MLNIILQSLAMIQRNTGKNSRDLFLAFASIRKRQEAPLDVVERIWGMSPSETRKQIELFKRFSIVEVNREVSHHGKSRATITVHDLVLEVSRYLAEREPGRMKETSCRVLNAYVSEYDAHINSRNYYAKHKENASASACAGVPTHSRMLGGKLIGGVDQWQWKKLQMQSHGQLTSPAHGKELFHNAWIEMTDDDCSMKNLFLLIDIDGFHGEVFLLLIDPCWISRQLKLYKRKQLDNVILLIMRHSQNVAERESVADAITVLNILWATLVESERYIKNSD